MISPKVLRENGIPFRRIIQKEGEIIVTFPYGYHTGFNHGKNFAEACNFASLRWVEFGKRAALCVNGVNDCRFNLAIFMQIFQPWNFVKWVLGK